MKFNRKHFINITLVSFVCFIKNMVMCSRILAFLPSPSISHQIMFQPIIRELSLRGHHVVSITPNPINDSSLTNLTEIDLSFLSSFWKQNLKCSDGDRFAEDAQKSAVKDFMNIASGLTDIELSHPDVRKIIDNKDEHFDLVIVEWIFYPSIYVFSERFKCPLVGIISLGMMLNGHIALGSHLPLAYESDMNVPYIHPMTFWERMDGMFYNIWFLYHYYYYLIPKEDQIARKHFGNDIPSLKEIEDKVSLMIINTHPAWSGARPNLPNVIEVGGMHRPKKNPLSKDFQDFLDTATQGVIYFSFGSNVQSSLITEDKIKIFVEVFNELPYKVIWKWEGETMTYQLKNVKFGKWLPQNDILGHRNVKVFITQAGLQSLEEAIHNRVPVVGIPFFGDQHGNARRVVALGIGTRLSFQSLNKEDLKRAIETVIKVPTYKQKITELSEILDDQIVNPLEKAVWWIEYVIRHKGAKHLRSPAADMLWVQSSMTDILIFLVICVHIVVVVVIYVLKILRAIYNKSFMSNNTKKND